MVYLCDESTDTITGNFLKRIHTSCLENHHPAIKDLSMSFNNALSTTEVI